MQHKTLKQVQSHMQPVADTVRLLSQVVGATMPETCSAVTHTVNLKMITSGYRCTRLACMSAHCG